jgi:predicted component of type VI protein secretion system
MKTKRRVIRKRRKSDPEKPAASVTADTAALIPREEVLNIIHTMRNQGATYDQIAKHLVDLGQPTFSGRGEWHAQTIHRLCSKK